MVQATLVETQLKNGQRLIDRLLKDGVPITGAGWLKETESGDWYLYVATSLVGEGGVTGPAYRRINATIRAIEKEEDVWLSPLEIKAIAPDDPIVRVLAPRKGRPSGIPARLGPAWLGELVIDEAYVYPIPDMANGISNR